MGFDAREHLDNACTSFACDHADDIIHRPFVGGLVHPQSIKTLSTMFKHLRAGEPDSVPVHRSKGKNMPPSSVPASSLQAWLCIASSSDIDAIVAELYT